MKKLSVTIPEGVEPQDVHAHFGKSGVNDHIMAGRTLTLLFDDDDETTQADLDAFAAGADTGKVLTNARIAAKVTVDRLAETARLKYVTPGGAQAMVYRQKYAEALDQLADASKIGPLLASEAARSNTAAAAVAATWKALADSWLTAAAAIEDVRFNAKEAIEAAADAEAIQAVVDGLTWPN